MKRLFILVIVDVLFPTSPTWHAPRLPLPRLLLLIFVEHLHGEISFHRRISDSFRPILINIRPNKSFLGNIINIRPNKCQMESFQFSENTMIWNFPMTALYVPIQTLPNKHEFLLVLFSRQFTSDSIHPKYPSHQTGNIL